jgi:hypothetical protein
MSVSLLWLEGKATREAGIMFTVVIALTTKQVVHMQMSDKCLTKTCLFEASAAHALESFFALITWPSPGIGCRLANN